MASFNKNDATWLPTIVKGGEFSPADIAILEAAFDHQTNYDCQEIELRMKVERKARMSCLYTVVMYPVESIFTRIFLDKKDVEFKRSSYKIHMSFLRKRIKLEEFKKLLANLCKDSNLVMIGN